MALRTPLQVLFAFWTLRLIPEAIGAVGWAAYNFAWGFGFLQFLLEFGMSSSLQRQTSEAWTKGDRAAVNRTIACGTTFYAAISLVQVVALLGIAYFGLQYSGLDPNAYPLIVKLLWLQAATAPCYGISTVVSSVLQAARRYDFIPRLELAIVILRFAVLWAGLRAGVDFFLVVATQVLLQVGLSLGPALWVMTHELGYAPHFRGARWADYKALLHISVYVSLIQLSVVLADKIDTTVLGFALDENHATPALDIYPYVSKPFSQLRQTGWMLAYLVMPAVASLAAARDARGLERIKYDGPRLHLGVILPVGLLAAIYANPFLTLLVPSKLDFDISYLAHLMRLFLVATIPLLIAVQVQAAIGMNRIKVIALAALAGALINLPISYLLTIRFQGVEGVIWGTVLTTLFSNLLIPGVYVFRVLNIQLRPYLERTLTPPLAGALALLVGTWLFHLVISPLPRGSTLLAGALPMLVHLSVGCLAYVAGYLAVPRGRADLAELLQKFGW
jgi:Na+-driven multidrug efflux pump